MRDMLFKTSILMTMMVIGSSANRSPGLLPQVGQHIENLRSDGYETRLGQVTDGVQCRPDEGTKGARFTANVVQDQQTVTYCRAIPQLDGYSKIFLMTLY